MIKITRLDNSECYINPHVIESLEETPDTLITLSNGKKIMIQEDSETIMAQFLKYQRLIRGPLPQRPPKEPPPA